MLLMMIIGWTVVLPTLVIGGLLLASTILGRRTRRHGAVDVTALAREIVELPPYCPRRLSTYGTVRSRIRRSSHSDQFAP